jgi:hypothetical protein
VVVDVYPERVFEQTDFHDGDVIRDKGSCEKKRREKHTHELDSLSISGIGPQKKKRK